MRSVIRQCALLPASIETLFEMYLSPGGHATITGSAAIIGAERGARFEAFEGMLTGQILEVIRPSLIVQSWRSAKFHEEDPDSTLILMFSTSGTRGRIDLIHLDVPEHDFEGVNEGWEKYYWTPWRDYLEMRS